ncbi:MAG: amidase [Candidatus Marinimicrobia bacterium]|nr:amidase [Candidatus Neomarinimicrobiota bacterium]MBL7009695.1 amidase [Candidatus Neomarinimicrobiota bacterium]MBL7029562.1 amidase [Candidatus Neomarinimicrobiota bacterium]
MINRRDFIKTSALAAFSGSMLTKLACAKPAFDEFIAYDALGMAGLVKNGEVLPIELVEAVIKRIEMLNPIINAVIYKDFERAFEISNQAVPNGPFKGVPFLIKDLVEYEGAPLTSGSRFFKNNMGKTNPPFIQSTKSSGLIIIGKTNTPEFGLLATTEPLLFGPTRNPWNLNHSSGGSSGGSAAAVAAGILPIAHASDGGGSIRIPASSCGLFGLKISRGREVSTGRAPLPLVIGVDNCVSRTVRDSAVYLNVILNPQFPGNKNAVPLALTPKTNKGIKIAFTTDTIHGKSPHPECIKAVDKTVKLCESLGYDLVEDKPIYNGEQFISDFLTVWGSIPAGLIAMLTNTTGKIPDKESFEPWTWGMADWFHQQGGVTALEKAIGRLVEVGYVVDQFHEQYDFYLTPTVAGPPPKIGMQAPIVPFDKLLQRTIDLVGYTPIMNVTGNPAMSVPLHWTKDGLPIGSHFSAKFGAEAELLQLAYQLEESRPWKDKWAPHSIANI